MLCVFSFEKGVVRVAGKAAHRDTNLVKNVRSQDEKIENSNCCVASFPPKMIFHVEAFEAFENSQ